MKSRVLLLPALLSFAFPIQVHARDKCALKLVRALQKQLNEEADCFVTEVINQRLTRFCEFSIEPRSDDLVERIVSSRACETAHPGIGKPGKTGVPLPSPEGFWFVDFAALLQGICGNGLLDLNANEQCDDGNSLSGDGCSDTCRIESGYQCAGEPSVCTTTCGDGVPTGTEQCDDGNTVAGDGCAPDCTVEYKWTCSGVPSRCGQCGDGVVAGLEGCDDGNAVAGDGCSFCHVELGFGCGGQPSVCGPICGDGLIRGGEGCDDGNTTDGDGCSARCLVEPGFSCAGEPSVCS